jgi:biotin operon repressor
MKLQAKIGDAWPSQKTIARDCALSERSVNKSIQDLAKEGWLVPYTRGKSGQGWRLIGYQASVPSSIYEKVLGKLRNVVPDVSPRRGEPQAKGMEREVEGTEYHDAKVRNSVPTNLKENYKKNNRESNGLKSAHQLIGDWQPNEDDKRFCKEKGHDPDYVFSKFKLHACSKAVRAADWSSNFRLWVCNERIVEGRQSGFKAAERGVINVEFKKKLADYLSTDPSVTNWEQLPLNLRLVLKDSRDLQALLDEVRNELALGDVMNQGMSAEVKASCA